MTLRTLTALVACLVALSACSDADDAEKSADADTSKSSSAADDAAFGGQLLESGFGQEDERVNGVALVKNDSGHAGQTVTVSFNFLDAAGQVVLTVSQVDAFNFPGQTIAVQGFGTLDSKGVEVARVEPTLLVENDGLFDTTAVDFGTAEAALVNKYGSWLAKVPVKNPTADPLQAPAVNVACRDAGGKIIGGGFSFPDLVPPGGEALAEVDLTVSGDPAECLAYIGGPIY